MNSMISDPVTLVLIIGGLMVGSFLNVCIYRIPLKLSIIAPRSHCTTCDHVLSAWENIPVFSYIFLRGRCSSCRERISFRYPLVELLTALVFLVVYGRFGWSADFLIYLVFAALLIVITFVDLDHMIIPNGFLLFGILPGLGLAALNWDQVHTYLIGALGLGAGFYLIGLLGNLVFKKESLGMGDVKFVALIGLMLGWANGLVAVFAAFISALVLFAALLPFGKISFSQKVPFGPFLSLGAFIGFLAGDSIIHWYLTMAF